MVTDSISITPLEFWKLFSQSEVVSIQLSVEPQLVYFRTLASVAERINSKNEEFVLAMNELHSLPLISNTTWQRINERMGTSF